MHRYQYTMQKNKALNLATEINKWFRKREITSWRKDIESLLQSLNVLTTE